MAIFIQGGFVTDKNIVPNDLFKILKKHQGFAGEFARLIDNELTMYNLDGKPMTPKEWGDYFRVEISHDITALQLRELQIEVHQKLETASFFLSHAQLMLDMFDEGSTSGMNEAFKTLVDTWQEQHPNTRLPAASTLEKWAQADQDNLIGGKANILARVNFFKSQVWKLKGNLETLRSLSQSLGLESKINREFT